MAKMKVHELAKELDRKSKELIDFLQARGYEVKVAQSSIEDDAIALVRKEFGAAGEKPASNNGEEKAQKTEEKPQKAEDAAKEKTASPAGDEKNPQTKPAAEKPVAGNEKREGKGETPKKKRIIFVSNPHNSKMGGRQSQGGGSGQNRGNGNSRPMSNGARPVQPQNTPHKIIRPTQKPIPVTAEPYDVRQKQQQERRLEQRQQEKRENSKNMAAGNRLPDRGEWKVQEKIADLRVRAGRIITAVRVIARVAALPSLAAGTVAVVTALREEMAGRTIDLRKITVRRTLSLRRPARMWKSTGTRKSAG
jgi:translation initiation factor IF-2